MADKVDGLQQKEENENFWKKTLEEVAAHASKRLPSNKKLLVVGDDHSGKTGLISKLRSPGEDEPKKGAGLEFVYLDVHDDERDEHTRLNVWVQDGAARFNNLLKFVVTADAVDDLTIAICVDMSKPWTIIDSLNRWLRVIQTHLHSLHLPAKQLNAMEAKLVKKYKEFVDFDTAEEDKLQKQNEETEEVPLGDSVLSNNLGIPIIVLVTKSDTMSTLEQEREYRDEHFDFIQKHIRQFCLKCGAALIYTSAKEACNVSLLYKYLLHSIYNFPLRSPTQIVEKDAIFIPMGWDNENKITILNEHIKTFNSNGPYKDFIVKPPTRKQANQEKEIAAEDEQTFLESQLVILQKAPQTSTAARPPQPQEVRTGRVPSTSLSPGQRPQQARPGIPNAKMKLDASKGAAAPSSSETVLANFFNSLLNKNTTGKAKSQPPQGAGASRSAVQAELERMSNKKPSGSAS